MSGHDAQAEGLSDVSDDDALSIADTDATSACSHSLMDDGSCACQNEDDATDFLDTEGQVGIAVESLMFLDNIKHIAEAVKSCWVKAGEGGVPVAATAAYTNVLLVRAATHVRTFHQNEPDLPSSLHIKQRLDSLAFHDQQHTGESQQDSSEILECLAQCHLLLAQSHKELIHPSSLQVNLDHAKSSGSNTTKRDMTESLTQQLVADFTTIQRYVHVSGLTSDGLSCMKEVSNLLNGSDDSTSALTAAVLLYLLAISHCSYSSVLSQPSRIALPRISALKMANETLSTIRAFLDDKSIFPCQCIDTLGYRVAQMKIELEAFSKYRCWSALVQSPLIAGNHVLEILDLCSYYGMYLFHYRQYVAAVLHTYQALIKLKALEEVPILEEASDLFAPVLYTTGIRPDSGFMGSWLRYIGARLKFKRGKKSQNHRETWCMSVPAHAAARSAGLNICGKNDGTPIQPKFEYGTIDHTTKMKRDGWVLQVDAVELLDQELYAGCSKGTLHEHSSEAAKARPELLAPRARRTKHKRSKSCQVGKEASQSRCEDCVKLDHSFNASFIVDRSERRNLPSARINLLSFFHSMTKVVSGISDTTHAQNEKNISSSSGGSGKGQMCLCFVQTVLRGADRILDVRKRSGLDAKGAVWSENERECIDCYKEHLVKMLEDAKVTDGSGGTWLWNSL